MNIAERKVISQPNAVITVTEWKLTDEAKRKLSCSPEALTGGQMETPKTNFMEAFWIVIGGIVIAIVWSFLK